MMQDELVNRNRQGVYAAQSLIVRAILAYGVSKGINHSGVAKRACEKGLKITRFTLSKLNRNAYDRQMSLFTLSVLCECVGLSLLDVVRVELPKSEG